jgi:hypothetical protein
LRALSVAELLVGFGDVPDGKGVHRVDVVSAVKADEFF